MIRSEAICASSATSGHKWLFFSYEFEIPVYIIGDIIFHNVVNYTFKEDYECPKELEEVTGKYMKKILHDEAMKKISIWSYSASYGDELRYEFTVTKPELDFIKKREYGSIVKKRSLNALYCFG